MRQRTIGAASALLFLSVTWLAVQAPAGLSAQRVRTAGGGGSTHAPPTQLECTDTIRDQATGDCLQASSEPGTGLLFPPPHDGGRDNVALGRHAFVGGGRENWAFGAYTTVNGGHKNVAEYPGTTVGGGGFNNAGLNYSTVSGGSHNRAVAGGGTVGGGYNNLAQGYSATVSGGSDNTAFGGASTVPGGHDNTAGGPWSFAAGLRAKAQHQGSFVWGDSQYMDKTSSVRDEFSVFASGGVRLFTGLGATTGVTLAPGAGSWSSASSRASKDNLEEVDGREVLERLVALPVWTWNYRTQDEAVRHMGPTSQDFREAFGLGTSPERIDTVDPDGVALAAIQGLHAIVAEKDAELARLHERLAALADEVAALRESVDGSE